jgi:hypothetical protein
MLRERLRRDFFNLVNLSGVASVCISVTIVSSILIDLTSETSISTGFIGKTIASVVMTSISLFILLSSLENKTLVPSGKAIIAFALNFPM